MWTWQAQEIGPRWQMLGLTSKQPSFSRGPTGKQGLQRFTAIVGDCHSELRSQFKSGLSARGAGNC